MLTSIHQPCDESVIRSGLASAPCSKLAGRWVLVATTLASSMAFIDSTVVNVALPALQTNLNATIVDVQWVIEAYSLLLSALLLVGGSLGDHYGRRRVFLIGIALFAAASTWCGLASDIHQLIVARAAQGLGAALLVPGSLAIISSSFPENERGRAIGTWSGFSAITTAIGPVIGGWLIEHLSWRAIFFINIPIAVLIILVSLWRVPESSDKESKGLDWLGAILVTFGLGALVYGLIESSHLGFGDRSVLSALIAAAALLGLFLIIEARIPNPMLPMALFQSRTFTGANLLTFLLYGALGGTLFFLPLNLIQVQHYSATAAGAAFLPFILIMFVFSRWAGGLVERYGSKIPLVIGPLIAALGFALFMLPGLNTGYWQTFFPAVAVLGTGMAVSVAPLTTTVMNSIAQNRVGVASGVNNAVARGAGLLAIAVLGIVMLHAFNHALDQRLTYANVSPAVWQSLQPQRTKLAAASVPGELDQITQQLVGRAIAESFVNAFRLIMAIGGTLAAVSAIVAWLLIGTQARKGGLSKSSKVSLTG
jgi:EmrB/QacA subfamily drug resistance transporter